MVDFFKRNLTWVAILLCITGIVLSIIGIPIGKPIYFFIGIVLSLPTVAYLLYQVFFVRDQIDLNLTPTIIKPTTSNITSIIMEKNDILLSDTITEDDDLESLYNGYASSKEITKHLQDITNTEREQSISDISDIPEIILPTAEPDDSFDDFSVVIENTTNDELTRQRQAVVDSPSLFEPEIPTELLDSEHEEISITDIVNEPEVNITSNDVITELSPATVTKKNQNNTELRKKRTLEKKSLLSQSNLERYLQRYMIETAACFLMNRTMYKDKHGIAPYNKFAVNKDTNLPEYSMSATKGRLYKFCTYLIDTERFITHSVLYNDFVTAVEQGVSLARVSETLHPLYRKKYKKDFVLNLTNREDWDNIMVLVYNNYLLNNDNFKDVFIRLTFELPFGYNNENVVNYLKNNDLQERFSERYSALEEMGIPTFWSAYYICFVNSIKQKLSIEQIENAILREHKKVTKALTRADNTRRRQLKKVS